MIARVAETIGRLLAAAAWLGLALVALVLTFLFWPFVREAQGGPRHRRGIAPPARPREEPLLPFGCGCCGQDCPDGELWCLACRAHVGAGGRVCDRTYFAQHGVDCPYTPKPPEEVRMMPTADQGDQQDYGDCSEGLGPRIKRRRPSHITPFDWLSQSEQALWRSVSESAK